MHLKSWRIDMTREDAKQLLPIIQAFSEGKCIQTKTGSGWVNMENMSFSGKPKAYRIKPESKYRPFENAEECWQEMLNHQPFGWLKGDKCFYNIVSVSNIDVSMANVSGDIVTLDFSEVMEDNTFADGTPFGVKIEEDYNGIK